MLVENLLGKPESCLTNSNRQLRETMKECGSGESVMVCCDNKTISTYILCQKATCGKCSQDNFRVTYVKYLACVKLTS